MPSLSIKNQSGGDAGSVDVLDSVFSAEVNKVVVRELLNSYLANQRQGTHATKTKGLVSGGGKKPWKQKGTGRARSGSNRSPLWRGGGTTFGPQPRDYREEVPKKKRRVAYRAIFSSLLEDNRLIVVDDLDFSSSPKTKKVVELMGTLGIEGSALFITKERNDMFYRAARNLPGVTVAVANAINVFDLLHHDVTVLTKDALESIQETLRNE